MGMAIEDKRQRERERQNGTEVEMRKAGKTGVECSLRELLHVQTEHLA